MIPRFYELCKAWNLKVYETLATFSDYLISQFFYCCYYYCYSLLLLLLLLLLLFFTTIKMPENSKYYRDSKERLLKRLLDRTISVKNFQWRKRKERYNMSVNNLNISREELSWRNWFLIVINFFEFFFVTVPDRCSLD